MDLRPILERRLERHRAEGFASLTGAAVDIRLPVRESMLADLLADLPRGVVREASVAIDPESRIRVSIATALVKTTFAFDIARAVDFAQDPRLRLKPASRGVLMIVLEKMLNALGKVPEGVAFKAGIVSIDLAMLLERGGVGDLAALVRTVHISSDSGVLFMDIALRVG